MEHPNTLPPSNTQSLLIALLIGWILVIQSYKPISGECVFGGGLCTVFGYSAIVSYIVWDLGGVV